MQVVIGENTGQTDLGQEDLFASYQLSGPKPIDNPDWRAVAFQAGTQGVCAVRVLADDALASDYKAAPLLTEIDVNGATIHPTSAEDCTVLSHGSRRFIGVECPSMTGTVDGKTWRVWIRMGWTEFAASTEPLPDWAQAALGPPASSPAAGTLALREISSESFLLPNPQPLLGATLEADTIAHGPLGWLAAGEVGPLMSGDVTSSADAPLWTSADGLDWQRLETSAFGGPGYQWVKRVAATSTGWFVVGSSYNEQRTDSFLWHNTGGQLWTQGVPPCGSPASCAGPTALDDIATRPDGGAVVVGRLADGPAVWNVGVDDSFSRPTSLPEPSGEPADARLLELSIAQRAGQYLVSGQFYSSTGSTESLWQSADGQTWELLAGVAGSQPFDRVIGTSQGWFGVAHGFITRSADSSHWQTVLTDDNAYFHDVAESGAGLVAIADGPSAKAYSSVDGIAWQPVSIPAGDRPAPWSVLARAIATDGSVVVIVGGVGEDAGFWTSAS